MMFHHLPTVVAATMVTLTWSFAPILHHHHHHHHMRAASSSSLDATAASSSLIVISPPGGIGEVAAVQAAEWGASVRWFVVNNADSSDVVLDPDALERIAAAGGSVELAGAAATSLLLPSDDPTSALGAVATWCGAAQALVCTLDGCSTDDNAINDVTTWQNAIKVAARQAAPQVTGTRVSVLDAADTVNGLEQDDDDDGDAQGGLGSLVGGLLGRGGGVAVPTTLAAALQGGRVVQVRHGQLFGLPESSPDFSPLVGGPRKNPELCAEYTFRAVRVDPTRSGAGNLMMGSNTRTSRHAVGQAAAWVALEETSSNLNDVSVTSLPGLQAPTPETWKEAFDKVREAAARTQSGAGGRVLLLEDDFASVPDKNRLADWLATKWAPAILRTYEIATIRSGARPVVARRLPVDDEQQPAQMEIVWQELVNFQTVTVGRMVIQVTETGLTAVRGPGDAAQGFGTVRRQPLAGEDVLVRRLAEATAQAVEKGLATKKKLVAPAPPKPAPVAVSSVQSVETVPVPSSSAGPRQAGAKRSTERARGSRKRKQPPSSKAADE